MPTCGPQARQFHTQATFAVCSRFAVVFARLAAAVAAVAVVGEWKMAVAVVLLLMLLMLLVLLFLVESEACDHWEILHRTKVMPQMMRMKMMIG